MDSVDHSPDRSDETRRRIRPVVHASAIAGSYVVLAALWIAVSDLFLSSRNPDSMQLAFAELIKGELFVVVTGIALFVVLNRYLERLRIAEDRNLAAQEALRQKDRIVRQGYVDVLDAVTGGKLILLTTEEMKEQLAPPVLGPLRIESMEEMSRARAEVRSAITPMGPPDPDALILAFGEALTNAVKHAGSAEYGVAMDGESLQVFVRDQGHGIDFRQLPKAALIAGFSTTNTLGFGFTIMLDVTDRVLLCTEAAGTSVVLEVETTRSAQDKEQRTAAEGPVAAIVA